MTSLLLAWAALGAAYSALLLVAVALSWAAVRATERLLVRAPQHPRRAVFAAQQARADESLYRWSWQAARLLEKSGEREAAIAAYRRSLASLQVVRQDLMLELRATRC